MVTYKTRRRPAAIEQSGMSQDEDQDAIAADALASARVARLATVGAGKPHLVPVVFAVRDGALWVPVDGKPKRHTRLKRLENIRANPRVCLLIDHYEEDWRALWWVRVDGRASVVEREDEGFDDALAALGGKYPQYASVPITSAIRIDIDNVSHWRARSQDPAR